MVKTITLSRKSRCELRELYKNYPDSTLRFDHVKGTVRLYTNGRDEKAMVFGDLGKALCELADDQSELYMRDIMRIVREMK